MVQWYSQIVNMIIVNIHYLYYWFILELQNLTSEIDLLYYFIWHAKTDPEAKVHPWYLLYLHTVIENYHFLARKIYLILA